MHRKFDLFEKFPDGSSLWRACVIGLKGTHYHLMELSKTSGNQFYAIDIGSGKVIYHSMDYFGIEPPALRKAGKPGKSAAA